MTDSATTAETPESKSNPSPGCACGGKGPVFSGMLKKMMPSQAAGEHFRNARLEMLKGFRELLDHRIESLSSRQQKGTKVNVE